MDIVAMFETLNAAAVLDFIHRGQEEHLFLDFKTVASPELRERDDRKSLACALSGFANSSGGLVVWGVDARKNANGVDCAKSAKEISNVKQLVTRLNELTGEGVVPLVDGVRHRAIPTSGGGGFAVTLVPESVTGPHMAKLGEDRFYKRSGDSFYRMEHFDISDMFGRRRRPSLRLQVRLLGGGGSTSGRGAHETRDVKIVLALENHGRGTARAPYLAFNVPHGTQLTPYGVDGNGREGLRRLANAADRAMMVQYGGPTNVPIHPGTTQDVAALVATVKLEHGRLTLVPPELDIEYEIAAEDVSLFGGHQAVTQPEMLQAVGLAHLIEEPNASGAA